MTFNLGKQDVWVTSDTHYNHSNICSATTRWEMGKIDSNHSGVRDFKSLKDMNSALLKGINKNVKPDDILIHLGDWSFGGKEWVHKFICGIACNNIYHVQGNHDHHIVKDNNLTSMFTSSTQMLQFKVQENKNSRGIEFFCSHYSHRVWDRHHKGVVHLFGHSHGGLDHTPNGRSMDVGVDPAFKRFGQYRPFNIRECIDICMKNEIQYLDHHKK